MVWDRIRVGIRERIAAEVADEPRWPNTRNTHLWCKGRVGIDHQFEWKTSHPQFEGDETWPYQRQKCSVCGKHGKLRRRPKIKCACSSVGRAPDL